MRLVVLAVALGGVALVLAATAPWLPAPPVAGTATAWNAWLQHVGAAGAAMALVRVGALVIALYLLAVVTIELAVRLTGLRAIAAVGRGLTAPAARRLVRAVAGVGLATSITAAALVGPAGAAGADPVPAAASSAAPSPAAGPPPPDALTMHRLDADPIADPTAIPSGSSASSASSSPTTSPTTAPPADPPDTPAPAEPPVMRRLDTDPIPSPGPPPAATWTIAPGDHLWHVAAATLAAAGDRPPTAAETARYLQRVIDRNRSVLIVADDPDLVRPGQVFVLPAPT